MTRELYVRYPRLLRPGSVRVHLAYGPGWFPLADEFLAGVNDRLSDDLAARFRVHQIKEKFGRMRIHYYLSQPHSADEDEALAPISEHSLDLLSPEIDAMKFDVEKRSGATCYFCGAPGIERKTLWMHVSCDSCEARLESKS